MSELVLIIFVCLASFISVAIIISRMKKHKFPANKVLKTQDVKCLCGAHINIQYSVNDKHVAWVWFCHIDMDWTSSIGKKSVRFKSKNDAIEDTLGELGVPHY